MRNGIELAEISIQDDSVFSTSISKTLNNNNNNVRQCDRCQDPPEGQDPPEVPSIVINPPPEENRAPIIALPQNKPEVLLKVPSERRLMGIAANDLDLQMGDGVVGFDLEAGHRGGDDLEKERRGSYGFDVVMGNGEIFDVQTVSRGILKNGGSYVDGSLEERLRREVLFRGGSELSLGGPGRTDSQEQLIERTNSEGFLTSTPMPRLPSPCRGVTRQTSALSRTFSFERKKRIDRCLTCLGLGVIVVAVGIGITVATLLIIKKT